MLKVSAHRVSDCNSLYTLQKPEETACSAFPGLAEQIRPYHSIPIFSPNASTAFLTHSGHGHNGTPVSIPFRSLQIVPPHLCWKSARISLEYRGVPLPAVRSPATTMAPINAPQVLSMQPIPAANPAVSFISSSEFTGSLSSNAFNTACVQLHWPVAFNSAAYSARSSIVLKILLCIFYHVLHTTTSE